MTTSDSFTDAGGNVFLGGEEERWLRAVGFLHRSPCAPVGAQVSIGKPYVCDCGGTVLIGWRDWWPLPDEPPNSIVVDLPADRSES